MSGFCRRTRFNISAVALKLIGSVQSLQPGLSPWCPELILRGKIGWRLIKRAGHDLSLGVVEGEDVAAAGRAETAVLVTRSLSLAS